MLFYLIAFKVFTLVCICALELFSVSQLFILRQKSAVFLSLIGVLSNIPRCLCHAIGSMVRIWNNSSALNCSIISAFRAGYFTLINTLVKMERGSPTGLKKEHCWGMTRVSFFLTSCNECLFRWNSLTRLWSFVMLSVQAIHSSHLSSDAVKRYFFHCKGIQIFNTEPFAWCKLCHQRALVRAEKDWY